VVEEEVLLDLVLVMVDQVAAAVVAPKVVEIRVMVDQDIIMVLMVLVEQVPVVAMVVITLAVVVAVLHTPSQVAQAREVELVDQALLSSDISSNN
tara:strand:+ start:634 stop:918 length:285 start_codon:yes stop_codon:yes gene_type:complete